MDTNQRRPMMTTGDGYWSTKTKLVAVTRMVLEAEGDFCVYFDTATWDTRSDGLIYTDRGWLQELREYLQEFGMSRAAAYDVDYSEQGMQGHDFVSLDVGVQFRKESHKLGL